MLREVETCRRREGTIEHNAHQHPDQNEQLDQPPCGVLKPQGFLAVHREPQARPHKPRSSHHISLQPTRCRFSWIAAVLASNHAGAATVVIKVGTERGSWLRFEQSGKPVMNLPKTLCLCNRSGELYRIVAQSPSMHHADTSSLTAGWESSDEANVSRYTGKPGKQGNRNARFCGRRHGTGATRNQRRAEKIKRREERREKMKDERRREEEMNRRRDRDEERHFEKRNTGALHTYPFCFWN